MDQNQQPAAASPNTPVPPANKKKTGLIVGSIAGAVVILGAIGFLIFHLISQVSPEDYTKAATSADSVAKQTKLFNDAGQEYANAALNTSSEAQIKELDATMKRALDSLGASHDELRTSPALRNFEVKQAYDAYNKKATVFKTVATGYETTIPLYVTMMRTCSAMTESKDIFELIKEFAAFAVGFTKEQALERFDTKAAACIDAASKLDKSGDDSFAKVGGVFFTNLTDTRKAIVARYDDVASKGRDRAELDYVRANMASEAQAGKSLQEISAQQKKEGQDGDYTAELKELTRVIQSKL